MIAYALVVAALLGVATAHYVKLRFSGKYYRSSVTKVILLCNCACVIFYIELMKNECVFFFKCFPGLLKEFPVIGWLAIICLFLHCCAIPTIWEPRRFFRFRRKNKIHDL